MTDKELQAIKERTEKTTLGPWEWYEDLDDYASMPELKSGEKIVMNFGENIAHDSASGTPPNSADSEFIAKARDDVPALIAEVERLRKIITAAGCAMAEGENGDAYKHLYNGIGDSDYNYFERINAEDEKKFNEAIKNRLKGESND